MKNIIANRVHKILPSITFQIASQANMLRNAGVKVINLSQGEPDFDTPTVIKEAALTAMQAGKTKYTAVDGIVELKTAIQQKLLKDNNLSYELDEIIVSSGAKQSISNLLLSLLNPQDEAIIGAPYWVSYPEMIKLAEGTPVIINTQLKHHLKLSAHEIEQHITNKTKLIILNSPCNPTGVSYTKQELVSIGKMLLKYPDIYILSDDIYEHTIWEGEFYNIAMCCPELKERTIIVNGVSKAYSMTGWRIGYAVAPKLITQAMKKIQSQTTSCPNSIAQYASVAALQMSDTQIQYMLTILQEKYTLATNALTQIEGIQLLPTTGTFYLFPNITDIITKFQLKDDVEYCQRLLQEQQLAIVPGSAFGSPNHVRISFASSKENILAGIAKIQQFNQSHI